MTICGFSDDLDYDFLYLRQIDDALAHHGLSDVTELSVGVVIR